MEDQDILHRLPLDQALPVWMSRVDRRLAVIEERQRQHGEILERLLPLNDWHYQVDGVLRFLKWSIPLGVALGSIAATVIVKLLG